MELHRYIPFESFVDIVQSKSLKFVYPPVAWEDTYEGFAYRAMQTVLGREKIFKILITRGVDKEHAGFFLRDGLLSILRYQCWTKAKDNIAMWSIYSFSSKTIMITTTTEKLEELTINGVNNVRFMPVNYVQSHSLEDELVAFTPTTFTSNLIFQSKRNEFMHEEEIRAFIDTAGIIDKKTPLKVPIPSVQDFIVNVLVHPSAPLWYVGVVGEFCRLNGINFSGQSKLYKFEC